MTDPFRDNVAIVTGASRGIGRRLALQLAARGARVALAARDVSALEQVAAECRALSPSEADREDPPTAAIAVPTDVTVEAACRALVDRTIESFGRVDTLINNAGLSMYARFEDLESMETIERLIQVNYLGAVYCTRHALPYLVETRGRLVGVASLTAKAGVPTRTGYAAAKHAMAGFFDSLRIELAPLGVTVTMAYPGFVDTGIRHLATGDDRGFPQQKRAGTVMSAETCARIILRAAEKRKRQVVMTWKGKVGRWLQLVAPRWVDRIAARAVGES